jgi:hypothetical protein
MDWRQYAMSFWVKYSFSIEKIEDLKKSLQILVYLLLRKDSLIRPKIPVERGLLLKISSKVHLLNSGSFVFSSCYILRISLPIFHFIYQA